jgi:hypothetical protein
MRSDHVASLSQFDGTYDRRKDWCSEQRAGRRQNGTTERRKNQLAGVENPANIGNAKRLLAHLELVDHRSCSARQLSRGIIKNLERNDVANAACIDNDPRELGNVASLFARGIVDHRRQLGRRRDSEIPANRVGQPGQWFAMS